MVHELESSFQNRSGCKGFNLRTYYKNMVSIWKLIKKKGFNLRLIVDISDSSILACKIDYAKTFFLLSEGQNISFTVLF